MNCLMVVQGNRLYGWINGVQDTSQRRNLQPPGSKKSESLRCGALDQLVIKDLEHYNVYKLRAWVAFR